jgi:catechol 2,3-dioxygenase-like lactoylglutathione lyase family enzyme
MPVNPIFLPTPSHMSVVVKDVDKTVEFLSSVWDVKWDVFDFIATEDEVIECEPFSMRVAHSQLGAAEWPHAGAMEWELLQPLDPPPAVLAEFLKAKGGGLHHIGWMVPNFDEMVSHVKQQGGRIRLGSSFKGMRWVLMETKLEGMIFEFVEQLEK